MSATAQTNRTSVYDPIDVVTGEMYLDREDFTLPGGIPIRWKTCYSNQLDYDGPLGWRWTHAYDCRLCFQDGLAVYITGQGSEVPFPEPLATGKPLSSADNRYTVEQHNTQAFSVVLPGGIRQGFVTGLAPGCAKLVMISDPNKRVIKFRYNELGQLVDIEDSAGRTLRCELDGHGRIVRITCFRVYDPRDHRVLAAYQYDGAGDLAGVMDACGNVYRYEYDEWHQILRKTDRNGYSFSYRYSGNRCIETWGDDGLYSGQLTYDPKSRRTSVIGFDGRKTVYHYNDRNLVVSEVDAHGYSTTTGYDQAGNAVLRIDRCGRPMVRKYDERGNVTEEIQPTGQKKQSEYDKQGRLLKTVEPNGEVRTHAYDQQGNVVLEAGSDGVPTIHTSDSRGRRRKTIRPFCLPETYDYDEFDQMVRIRDATGSEIGRYDYDLVGNITATTFGSLRIEYSYDAMSRMTRVQYPDSTTEESTYDAEGNPTSYKDRLGHIWQYAYKARKQLIQVINPDGGVTKYDYTPADEKYRVIDPNGNITEYSYNLCDQITEIHRNGLLLERYKRDPEGRLIAKINGQGNDVLRLAYGLGDQPETRISHRDGTEIQSRLAYDQYGRVVAAQDQLARVARSYHSLGHITSEQSHGHGVRHDYDSEGRLLRTAFDDGVEFRLKYHGDTAVIRDPLGHWHTRRSRGSRIAEVQLASGVQEVFSHDGEGHLASHVISHRQHGLYFSAAYKYGWAGRLVRWRSQGQDRVVEYDADSRLTRFASVTRGGQETFRYDHGGNLFPAGEFVKIDSGNRLTEWDTRRFSYDSSGRLSSEARGQSSRRYHYDSAGQLIAVESDSGRIATYEYDALRRRTAKTTPAGRVLFGWEGTRLAWELHSDGQRRDYFYVGPKEHSPVMYCDTVPQPEGANIRRMYFVHYDASRRPVLITDSDGGVAWSADWSAYGLASVHSADGVEYNLRAPGQYYDAETGLHYNYHRYYDPEIGRYTQPDPIGLAGGLNLYAYANGDPLFACDVLGLANT